MLPFVLRLFELDPASAPAPSVATVVDVTGLTIYLKIAGVVLRVAFCDRDLCVVRLRLGPASILRRLPPR